MIRQALQHVTDVARHASGRRVDFEPLSILSQELQTTLVGAEQERDEIDILVRTSAHAINQELNMPIVHSIIGYENPRSRRR